MIRMLTEPGLAVSRRSAATPRWESLRVTAALEDRGGGAPVVADAEYTSQKSMAAVWL